MIVRRKLTANYTAIPNEILNNQNLSIEARWMLCYLLTKPDNWVVRVTDIQAAGGLGRNKTYEHLKELCEAGYVVKQEIRNKEGIYSGVEYLVRDVPETTSDMSLSPRPCLRDAGIRDTANQHLNKYSEVVSTDTLDTSVSKDARDELWQAIPRVSRQTGIPEKRLRPMVGKWLKTLDDNAEVLNMVLSEAEKLRPADFVSWVTAAIISQKKKGQSTQDWYDVWK